MTGDRRPPLVFDDPFVTFDDDRARRSVELLRRLASDFQVIYLTTSDRYDAAADVVIELAMPDARDEAADAEAELEAAETERALIARGSDWSPVLVREDEEPGNGAAAAADMVSEGGPVAVGQESVDAGAVADEEAVAGVAAPDEPAAERELPVPAPARRGWADAVAEADALRPWQPVAEDAEATPAQVAWLPAMEQGAPPDSPLVRSVDTDPDAAPSEREEVDRRRPLSWDD